MRNILHFNFFLMNFPSDYYLKLKTSLGELSEKENGFPLIQNAMGGMDYSVLKVECVEFGIRQVSGNDALDSDSRELLAQV